MNKPLLIGGAIVLVIAGFVAGALLGPQLMRATGLGGQLMMGAPGGAAGGPMADLTEEERAELQDMTDEERRTFFAEKTGGLAPTDRAGGPGGVTLEGEVVEATGDTITVKTAEGGSQAVYVDDDTTVAYVKGAEGTGITAGASVLIVAQPEGENVLAAQAVVVR
jgi:hypothetical protein